MANDTTGQKLTLFHNENDRAVYLNRTVWLSDSNHLPSRKD